MINRAVRSAIIVFALFAGVIPLLQAGDFLIQVPKRVQQGDRVTIEIKADQSTAKNATLSITSRNETRKYDLILVNGQSTQDFTFVNAGSHILKVEDSANTKSFNTKSLHVMFNQGGKK